MTKKRNQISVTLTEASTVAYDSTRQPSYDFDSLLGGIMVLADEYEELKRERKKARLQILQEELEHLENE